MEYKDYYKVMGVEKNASQDEIKRAYRKLARKYHPDVSKEADAEQKFKELGEAYEVLKDPEKRAKYDQYGQQWKQWEQQEQYRQSSGGPSSQYYSSEGFEDTAGFEDFINSIFAERARQQTRQTHFAQGQDIHARLAISLEESYEGAEKSVQLQVPQMTQRGQVSYQNKTVKVKIPKGITDKKQIRLKGQGMQVEGGQPGDLYIEINLLPHSMYSVNGKDITLELPISPWEAALGAKITVPTLAGQVNVTLPKGSQTGNQLKLKGKGLPGNPAGDQYLRLKMVIPKQTTEAVEAIYQSLAEQESNFNPRSSLGV